MVSRLLLIKVGALLSFFLTAPGNYRRECGGSEGLVDFVGNASGDLAELS